MTGSVILDVIIGLVFIYLLYSLLATILQELIATKLAFRSKVLEKAIIRMLEDGNTTNKTTLGDRLDGFYHLLFKPNRLKTKKIASWFYAHPLIKYLGEDNFFSKPAYISSSNFSKVILDLLHGIDGNDQMNVLNIKNSILSGTINTLSVSQKDKNHPAIQAITKLEKHDGIEFINKDTALFLRSLWMEAEGDLEKFRAKLENWFDDTMERATGWYKRYTKYILFIIGFLVAVAFNVDSVDIAKKLSRDPKLRDQMVQNASNFLKENQQLGLQLQQMHDKKLDSTPVFQSTQRNYDSLAKRSKDLMDSANALVNGDIKNTNTLLGLGYNCDHYALSHILFFLYPDASFRNFIGWLLTALAISLGAPFWFDMLNKLMKLRGSGTKIDSNDTVIDINKPAALQPVVVTVNSNPGEEAVG
ncbi:hypothetical protein FRZ67_12250 [Panacibacter ginsenosidivorans]|uniref:Uncharacterized protein n=1 Tax=Panacibacter ginsenosidivorans TaxID=1813871 RepID=A0A5B8V955_9BACT|nr:hypothetical protein [Panacibacter ginsenosidivorans]QEC68037.1 hypothetical protein FRZ67_12250 [Panacibacter ginsenosidivorans]